MSLLGTGGGVLVSALGTLVSRPSSGGVEVGGAVVRSAGDVVFAGVRWLPE